MTELKLNTQKKWDTKRILDLLINNVLIIIMLGMVIYATVTRPTFLNPNMIGNIISQTAAYLPVALGVAGTIVLTGTDLSAGRMLGLSACISASLLQRLDATPKMFPGMAAWSLPLVLLLVVVIGGLVGAFNGFWVAKFKLHPFIVTLATQLILYTILLLYVSKGGGQAISQVEPSYTNFVTGTFFSIPMGSGSIKIQNIAIMSLVLTAFMWFVWNKTSFGKNMFAVGANEEAAHVAGVNIFWTIVAVFALAGALYGYAGFMEAARIGSNTANTGVNAELEAIAACVIGGVSFVGGTGKISGIILGVLLMRLIFIILPVIGMDQQLQYAIKGGIILIACAVDMRKYLVKR